MVAYTNYESDARVIREAEAALSGGFEVDFLSLRSSGDAPTEMVRGVRIIRLNQSKYRGRGHIAYMLVYLQFFVRSFFRITQLYWQRRYCIIHANNMPDFLVFSALIPKLFGTKVILDIHDPMPNTFSSKFKSGDGGFFYHLLLWQERLSARFANQVITVHEPVKFGILEKHGLPADSIAVVANFADGNLFKVQDYPLFDGQVRLIYHGTILERSGLRTLIMALAQTRNREKLHVKIIGQGDFSAELRRLIENHGLQHTVEFINRSYSHYEIPLAVADCHCGLVPLDISSATNYALPLKLVEYVCMGLPAIAVQNEAIKYYFAAEDCLYFQAGDINSLRDILERVAANPSILNSFRERSLAIRKNFLWEPQRLKYIGILNRLSPKFADN